jgi:hypothetical protein
MKILTDMILETNLSLLNHHSDQLVLVAVNVARYVTYILQIFGVIVPAKSIDIGFDGAVGVDKNGGIVITRKEALAFVLDVVGADFVSVLYDKGKNEKTVREMGRCETS